jgi:putative effector of murein hydrolase LrgA (UPF0299 family)
MKKVISFLFSMAVVFFFFKSVGLSFLYLYKTGGVLFAFFGLFMIPFVIMIVPFFSGFQQGDWRSLISGLAAILCVVLAGLFSEKHGSR